MNGDFPYTCFYIKNDERVKKNWLQDVYFPSVDNNSHLIVDDLKQNCDDIIREAVSKEVTFELKTIPAGATSKV